eukprot:gb/GECG01014649.1/.p1 GENE.gb/GECG01014649.1/~~gb/GECG01014649.1/.p1  ORF type:complete len:184 (+),score=24.62 gb/GECG01014649.1/:1-552(+)
MICSQFYLQGIGFNTTLSVNTNSERENTSMSASAAAASGPAVEGLPLLKAIDAGPLSDKGQWEARLKEEFRILIEYQKDKKAQDSDWFSVKPADKKCIKWEGKCWIFVSGVKYQFGFEFEIPSTYPTAPFEIIVPELDGKTVKMYKGGKICLSDHFFSALEKKCPTLWNRACSASWSRTLVGY